jgi:hypothetical protein
MTCCDDYSSTLPASLKPAGFFCAKRRSYQAKQATIPIGHGTKKIMSPCLALKWANTTTQLS